MALAARWATTVVELAVCSAVAVCEVVLMMVPWMMVPRTAVMGTFVAAPRVVVVMRSTI